MSESIHDKQVFSLLEVTRSIQKTVADRYKNSFWVKAEMNKLNHYSHSGHCYPELVEKSDGKIIAQIKSSLWKSDYQRINQRFFDVLKEPLKDGIKILFNATISFDPIHGLSLRILDIDPSFSLGELEREKQQSIERLAAEGIINNNKKLNLVLLPQRIAVISVETSKGYSDYLKVIEQNPWKYKVFNMLFPSLLQGDKSIITIIEQLNRIKKVIHHFDAVAIIRGGGGDVGLSSYNNYELAREIALFPLPVLTGIGHSTNETVVEMVSYKNAITPTELADFLIQYFHNFSVPVKKAQELIVDRSRRILLDERRSLQNSMRYFQSVTNNQLIISHNDLNACKNSLTQHSKFLIRQEYSALTLMLQNIRRYAPIAIRSKVELLRDTGTVLKKQAISFLSQQNQSMVTVAKTVHILDPINTLKRGFSITTNEKGKLVNSVQQVNTGDTLTTLTKDGKIVSEVKAKM